jgi:hypothetical protein
MSEQNLNNPVFESKEKSNNQIPNNVDLPAYLQALKFFEKKNHDFEHKFFPNINKYSNSEIDTKMAIDNNPDLSQIKEIPEKKHAYDSKNNQIKNS